MLMHRRGFIAGLVAIVASPAIVRASSLMPVKALPVDVYNVDEIVALLAQRIDAAKVFMARQLADRVFSQQAGDSTLNALLNQPSEIERWRIGAQYVRSSLAHPQWKDGGYGIERDHLTAVGERIVLNG